MARASAASSVASALPFDVPSALVLGHEGAREQLSRAALGAGPAPAYVFSGARGVGKRTCALWMARLLFCARRPRQSDPCNVCGPCTKVLRGTHPDVYELRKDANKTQIAMEKVRDMLEAAEFAPMEAEYKLFLVSEAEQLNVAGMNGLLKNLEEPRPEHVFVLAVPGTGTLLPTVLSRCQVVRFSPVEPGAVSGWLEGRGISPDRARLASVLSEGSPGLAVTYAGDERYWEAREHILSLAASLSHGDLAAGMAFVERLDDALGSDKRGEIDRILTFLLSWYRDLLWLREGLDHRVVNFDRIDGLRRAGEAFDPARLLEALQGLQRARELMRKNANSKLLFTRLMLRLVPSA